MILYAVKFDLGDINVIEVTDASFTMELFGSITAYTDDNTLNYFEHYYKYITIEFNGNSYTHDSYQDPGASTYLAYSTSASLYFWAFLPSITNGVYTIYILLKEGTSQSTNAFTALYVSSGYITISTDDTTSDSTGNVIIGYYNGTGSNKSANVF